LAPSHVCRFQGPRKGQGRCTQPHGSEVPAPGPMFVYSLLLFPLPACLINNCLHFSLVSESSKRPPYYRQLSGFLFSTHCGLWLFCPLFCFYFFHQNLVRPAGFVGGVVGGNLVCPWGCAYLAMTVEFQHPWKNHKVKTAWCVPFPPTSPAVRHRWVGLH